MSKPIAAQRELINSTISTHRQQHSRVRCHLPPEWSLWGWRRVPDQKSAILRRPISDSRVANCRERWLLRAIESRVVVSSCVTGKESLVWVCCVSKWGSWCSVFPGLYRLLCLRFGKVWAVYAPYSSMSKTYSQVQDIMESVLLRRNNRLIPSDLRFWE